ncbi:hypothetical protein Asulf_01186 [Archaeoglobus sulfaticallidus PM70-1]|uniref:Uncharacterized protein n=1 Tax=Archaeoglobus sulfaticallidus PM70-1 TaxID=387631 RepID=N0BLS0_9EURY|nr:hypothetical protein Asulf_01186 [Archaeoglobus sulfaticallidus PM70-1]
MCAYLHYPVQDLKFMIHVVDLTTCGTFLAV